MANIEKIKLNNTSYDIVDATAAHELSDIAEAGTGISFSGGTATNYTVVGSPTIDQNYVASGFSTSNYLTIGSYAFNTANEWEIKCKVTPTTTSGTQFIFGTLKNNNTIVVGIASSKFQWWLSSSTGSWNIASDNGTYAVTANTTYYLKAAYSNGTYTLSVSTDGTNWTDSSTITSASKITGGNTLYVGTAWENSSSEVYKGAIDLKDFSISLDGVEVWEAVGESTKSSINCTLTGLPSQTSQSGKFLTTDGTDASWADALTNTATGTNSLTILGTATTQDSAVNVGVSSKANSTFATAVGRESAASFKSTAVGAWSVASGVGAIAIGGVASYEYTNNTKASANYTTAIGSHARATAIGAIQLGRGENSTAGTIQVSLTTDGSTWSNYQLLDATGKIPAGRLTISTSVSSASTNAEVVGSKLFYDTCGDIETLINAL